MNPDLDQVNCERCGYNKCIGALEFHHLDPTIKDELVCRSRSFEKAKKEMDKCVLLCSNCHREEHESLGIEVKEKKIAVYASSRVKK